MVRVGDVPPKVNTSSQGNEKAAAPPKPFRRGFSARTNNTVLARLLTKRRIKRMDLCAHLRVSERQGYNIMSRARPVTLWQLHRVCDLLDVDPEDIVDGSNYLLTLDK